MYESPTGDVSVSTSFKLPTYRSDRLYHILLGDYAALINAINQMSVCGYCDRVAWMTPMPTGRNGEYISVMTRRIVSPKE